MEGDRFVYQQGDIEIKKMQCDFCELNNKDNCEKCEKFPNGKPADICKNKVRCPFLMY